MSIQQSLNGTIRFVPETNEVDWGENLTGIVVDLMKMADGGFMLLNGQGIALFRSTTNTLAAAATLLRTHGVHKIQGSGGAVTLNTTTAITDGTADGELLILQGDHATNTVTLQDGANVQLRGDCTLGLYDNLVLRWDANAAGAGLGEWIEVSRKATHKLTNQLALEFYEGRAGGTNKVSLRAPATLAGDYTLTLPLAQGGAATYLQNDGSGVLSWVAGTAVSLQGAYDAGASILIGAGGPIVVDRAAGGEVLRLKATTSGDPHLLLEAGSATSRFLQQRSGTCQIGSFSGVAFELMTNSVARQTFLSTGEAGIGAVPESGITLKVGGKILLTNNSFLQGENSTAGNEDLIGINGSNQVIVGGAPTTIIVKTGSTEALHVDSAQRVAIGQVGATTAKLHVEQSGDVICLRAYKSGVGAGNAVEIQNAGTGNGLLVTQDGAGIAIKVSLNETTSGIDVLQLGTGYCIFVDNTNAGAAQGVGVRCAGTGICGAFQQDGNGVALDVRKNGTGTGTALVIVNAGTSDALSIQQDGVSRAVIITCPTNSTGVQINKTGTGSGVPLLITDAGSGKTIDTDSGAGTPAHLTSGGTWTNASCWQSIKTGFEPVDREDFLEKVSRMRLQRYVPKDEIPGSRLGNGAKEFGPLQDDLVGLFGLNDHGVRPHEIAAIALVGIQALVARLDALDLQGWKKVAV